MKKNVVIKKNLLKIHSLKPKFRSEVGALKSNYNNCHQNLTGDTFPSRFSLGKLGFEPSPTAQMVAQIASRNVEESSPGLPGAQNYMPHLRNKPLAMRPVVNISQGRMEGRLVPQNICNTVHKHSLSR